MSHFVARTVIDRQSGKPVLSREGSPLITYDLIGTDGKLIESHTLTKWRKIIAAVTVADVSPIMGPINHATGNPVVPAPPAEKPILAPAHSVVGERYPVQAPTVPIGAASYLYDPATGRYTVSGLLRKAPNHFFVVDGDSLRYYPHGPSGNSRRVDPATGTWSNHRAALTAILDHATSPVRTAPAIIPPPPVEKAVQATTTPVPTVQATPVPVWDYSQTTIIC